MEEQTKGLIGIREYVAIICITIGVKLTDDTPTILYSALGNAAWMSPIIAAIIALIPMYLLIKVLTLYKSKNLIEVITHLFGKYIGFFVLFLLWLPLSMAITIDTSIYTDIIGSMYFTKTPTLIIYTVLMAVCAYGAKKGLEQIGSVAWAILPYIKISLLLALMLTIGGGNTVFLYPLFGPGEWEVIKESTMKMSIYIDLFYLCLLFPYISSTKDFRKGTWIGFIIVIVELTVALLAYILMFDYPSIGMLNYPFHEAIRFIHVGFLSNVETFFLPFWLIASFVRIAVYLYLNGILFGGIFHIKNFEFVIPTLATVFVLLGMIPESPTFAIFHLREKLLQFSTPVFFFLPCLLWFAAKLKGDFKNEKANTNM